MPRTVLVVNPAAGGGRCGARVGPVAERLRAAGLDVELLVTRGPGDATRLVREARGRGEARFVAVGGDGTGFEVVDGLFPWTGPGRPTLGFLPLGTGNSFVRDLDLGGADDAVARIVAGRTRAVDVLRATCDEGDFHSINLIGLGFTAEVGELTNRRFKALGPLGYVAATVIRVATLHTHDVAVRVDAAPRDARPSTFLALCNSRYTGGAMRMAPDAAIDDGLLELVRVGPMGRLRLLTAFPRIFRGTHVQMPENEVIRARRVAFELDGPTDLMVDGEILRRTLRAVEVVPAAVEVLA